MSSRVLVLLVVGALLVAVVLFGLLGIFLLPWLMSDPPPDPSTAPLEIVANDADAEVCILNREEVGAGSHEIYVIAEQEPVTVELRDRAGELVYREAGEGPGQVDLAAGDYRVVCAYDGGRAGETPLTVTP